MTQSYIYKTLLNGNYCQFRDIRLVLVDYETATQSLVFHLSPSQDQFTFGTFNFSEFIQRKDKGVIIEVTEQELNAIGAFFNQLCVSRVGSSTYNYLTSFLPESITQTFVKDVESERPSDLENVNMAQALVLALRNCIKSKSPAEKLKQKVMYINSRIINNDEFHDIIEHHGRSCYNIHQALVTTINRYRSLEKKATSPPPLLPDLLQ